MADVSSRKAKIDIMKENLRITIVEVTRAHHINENR